VAAEAGRAVTTRDVTRLSDFRAERDPEYDGITCDCGSAWFTVQMVALKPDWTVGGYYAPVTCRECGAEMIEGAWVRPDLRPTP
jgi:hypothetical protein